MNALDLFRYNDAEVRVTIVDGEPHFIAADVCDYFGVTNRNRVMQGVDPEDKGGTQIDTPGGRQTVTTINESGLYALLFALQPQKARGIDADAIDARTEKVRRFKRWVTHDVLPAIRKTGQYGAPAAISFEEMTAHVIDGLQQRIHDAEQRAKELESPAQAWTALSSAEGDFTVSDAAKTLARAGIATGPRKLYDWLDAEGWVFRRGGRWQAMQSAINSGLIVERVTSGYFDQTSGERKQADPQVRITPKGLERLRDQLVNQQSLALIDGGAP